MARARKQAQPLKARMETLGWKLGISGIVIGDLEAGRRAIDAYVNAGN